MFGKEIGDALLGPGLEAVAEVEEADVAAGGEKVLANNQCDAAEVYTTDAALKADNLTALTDDKKLKREGQVDQAAGQVKQKVEKVIDKVKDAVR